MNDNRAVLSNGEDFRAEIPRHLLAIAIIGMAAFVCGPLLFAFSHVPSISVPGVVTAPLPFFLMVAGAIATVCGARGLRDADGDER